MTLKAICSDTAILPHYLYFHRCVDDSKWLDEKTTWNILESNLFVYKFSVSFCFFLVFGFWFYQAIWKQSAPAQVCSPGFMHATLLFVLLLFVDGFLFCITRTNLIRAEGIQISVHPPNAIWSLNKGLGERKERIANVFSRAGKRIAGGMWVF